MTPLEQARELVKRATENTLKAIAIHENCKVAYHRKCVVRAFKNWGIDLNLEFVRWAILDSLILSLFRLYDKSNSAASLSKFQRVVKPADIAREVCARHVNDSAEQRSIEQALSGVVQRIRELEDSVEISRLLEFRSERIAHTSATPKDTELTFVDIRSILDKTIEICEALGKLVCQRRIDLREQRRNYRKVAITHWATVTYSLDKVRIAREADG